MPSSARPTELVPVKPRVEKDIAPLPPEPTPLTPAARVMASMIV